MWWWFLVFRGDWGRISCDLRRSAESPPEIQEIATTQVSWAEWTILLHLSRFWRQLKISHTFLYMTYPIAWASCDVTCVQINCHRATAKKSILNKCHRLHDCLQIRSGKNWWIHHSLHKFLFRAKNSGRQQIYNLETRIHRWGRESKFLAQKQVVTPAIQVRTQGTHIGAKRMVRNSITQKQFPAWVSAKLTRGLGGGGGTKLIRRRGTGDEWRV